MDKLSSDQLKAFDAEYIDEDGMASIFGAINRHFPEGRFSFLDIGGGNGWFADELLAMYPAATGMVLDSSAFMVEKNSAMPRKSVILGDAADVKTLGRFDIIFCNLVLHHLVTTGSYRQTLANVESVLEACRESLTEQGRISVYEIHFDGWIDHFPGRAVFELTSSRALAPLIRRFGGNTAGVGACFRSQKGWAKVFSGLGLEVDSYFPNKKIVFPTGLRRHALLVKETRYGHYWLRRHQAAVS